MKIPESVLRQIKNKFNNLTISEINKISIELLKAMILEAAEYGDCVISGFGKLSIYKTAYNNLKIKFNISKSLKRKIKKDDFINKYILSDLNNSSSIISTSKINSITDSYRSNRRKKTSRRIKRRKNKLMKNVIYDLITKEAKIFSEANTE